MARLAAEDMVAAATSQLSQGLLPPDTAASNVRALVAAPGDDADDDGAPVAVSDPQEADAEDLAPTAAAPARGLAGAARACAENPVGVAKASAGGGYTVANGLTLCAGCNQWVEDEPVHAHSLGLVVRRGETHAQAAARRRVHGIGGTA